MEIWKDILGYEGLYQVSNYGKVKSLSRVKISKNASSVYSFKTKDSILNAGIYQGYEKVVLYKDGAKKNHKVHRLVISAFKGVQEDMQVNHIDFNRANNRIDNLEWCSPKENVSHSRKANRYPKMKISKNHRRKLDLSVMKKVICTESGRIYNSVTEASKDRNIKKSTLIHYLLGTRTNKTTLKYF